MRTTMIAAVGVAALAALTGCGGSSSGGSSGGGGTGASSSPQHPSGLVGTVGKNDAFTISLTDPQGSAVSSLVAASYQLVVHDDSDIHNFHLTGTGVDEKTPISSSGDQTFTVNLKPGTYTFLCDAHPTQMKGTFTVS